MKKQRPEPMCRSQYHYFFCFFVSILLNENRTKSKNERENIHEQKRKGEEIIVVASRRRGYEGAGQGHIFPDTTSGGGSPRASLEMRVSLERNLVL